MEEIKTENTPVSENVPSQVAPGNGKTAALLVVVVLVVALGAAGFLYFMGSSQPEEASPSAVPTKTDEENPTATPVVAQPQGSGSAEEFPKLSSGNSADDILNDLNSATINSFDSDFTDLQKDASGL